MWPIGHGFGQLARFGHGFGHYFSPHLGLKSYTKLLSNGQTNCANHAKSEPEACLRHVTKFVRLHWSIGLVLIMAFFSIPNRGWGIKLEEAYLSYSHVSIQNKPTRINTSQFHCQRAREPRIHKACCNMRQQSRTSKRRFTLKPCG